MYFLFFAFSGSFYFDNSLFVLLRLLHCPENPGAESLLLSSPSSNQRVQFDIQWDDVLSTNTSYVSQLFGSHSHGLSHYQNAHFGNPLHAGKVLL